MGRRRRSIVGSGAEGLKSAELMKSIELFFMMLRWRWTGSPGISFLLSFSLIPTILILSFTHTWRDYCRPSSKVEQAPRWAGTFALGLEICRGWIVSTRINETLGRAA